MNFLFKLSCYYANLFLVSAARYADVSLEYGTHGRVYIRHYQYGYNTYEVCSNGFSNTDGEAICRSRGMSYGSYTTYVICNHSMFELDLKCLIPMYCTLMGTFFSVLHQATISPQRPPIAIHTTFISVASGLKATVHGQYTFIVLVGISLFFHSFVLTNIYIYLLFIIIYYYLYIIYMQSS